jgi:hypothetical protein
MGSSAINKNGSMLIGYSLADASASLKPSIAVAGRLQSDPLNTLQAESVAVTGTGSQTGTLTRWGDYSTMQVDPADDSTFWFTTEYLSADGTFNWRTRIVSYKFPETRAVASGDFNVPANWDNGVPNATISGTIPVGRTITVNSAATATNLTVESGANLVMNGNLDITGSLTLGTVINTGTSTLGLGCNATVSSAGTGKYIVGNIRKDFCQTGAFSYPTGTANGYSPANVNITTLTTNPSSLLIKANQGNRVGMDSAQSAARFWSLSLTGALTADLVFTYLDPTDVNGTEANYKLYRFVGATGTAVTPFALNTTANTISANGISAFSDWAVGNLAPTAANVSVSGLVRANGQAVSRAIVVLTDPQGNVKTATTNVFGIFRIEDIGVGQNYVVSVRAKGLQFNPQVLSVSEEITGLELNSLE